MATNNTEEEIFNPNKNLPIPKWINEEYFSPILEKNIENFRNILKFTPVAATAPGENYRSIMVRVVIEVQLTDESKKEVSYILKSSLESGNARITSIAVLNLFPKEMQMYANNLLKFEQLYRDAGAPIHFSPKCVHCEDIPERSVLVMEDLERTDFKTMDRLKGFDLTHMRVVLNKLAELHAASAVYRELNGPYGDVFRDGVINESTKAFFAANHEFHSRAFANAMKEWGLDHIEKYNKRFIGFESLWKEIMRINRADPDEFNVLNHGDIWTNNIMFKHNDKGQVENSVFVDFQLCKWGTPVQDLWYLFTTSVQVDIRVQEFDHFIEIYHSRLVECLTLLKDSKPIPGLKQLHILTLKYCYWGAFTAHGATPIMLIPYDKNFSMDKVLGQDLEAAECLHKVLTAPIYAKSMRQWYPFLYNKGAFDTESKN